MSNGKRKPQKDDGVPDRLRRQAGTFDHTLMPREVGAQAGRVRGDPRFTASEQEASLRVAEREMAKALKKQAGRRMKGRRF